MYSWANVVIPLQTRGFYNIALGFITGILIKVVIPLQTRGFYNPTERETNSIPVVIPLQTRGFYNAAANDIVHRSKLSYPSKREASTTVELEKWKLEKAVVIPLPNERLLQHNKKRHSPDAHKLSYPSKREDSTTRDETTFEWLDELSYPSKREASTTYHPSRYGRSKKLSYPSKREASTTCH